MTQPTHPQAPAQAPAQAPKQDRTSDAKARLVDVLQYMRDHMPQTGDVQGATLFKTTTEVLQGLVNAHDYYELRTQTARNEKTATDQPKPDPSDSSTKQVQATAYAKSTAQTDLNTISREDLRKRLDSGQATVLFDMRTPEAWNASETKLPGAIYIPADNPEIMPASPDGSMVVVYSSGPSNDYQAVINSALAAAGYTNVFVLDGGFDAWEAADYPLENKTAQEKSLEAQP